MSNHNIDLMVQVLVIYFISSNIRLFENLWNAGFPYLPFLTFFDLLSRDIFSISILAILIGSSLMILMNRCIQVFSVLMGSSFLILIVSSKPLFSNSSLLLACILVLSGLSEGRRTLFRYQLSLLYLGAAINKVSEIDWWNGHYFNFLASVIPMPTFEVLSASFGSLTTGKFFGIGTMIIELILGIGVLFPKATRTMVILGWLFHGGMLVMTMGTISWSFFYLLSAIYLVLLSPEQKGTIIPVLSMTSLTTFLEKIGLTGLIGRSSNTLESEGFKVRAVFARALIMLSFLLLIMIQKIIILSG